MDDRAGSSLKLGWLLLSSKKHPLPLSLPSRHRATLKDWEKESMNCGAQGLQVWLAFLHQGAVGCSSSVPPTFQAVSWAPFIGTPWAHRSETSHHTTPSSQAQLPFFIFSFQNKRHLPLPSTAVPSLTYKPSAQGSLHCCMSCERLLQHGCSCKGTKHSSWYSSSSSWAWNKREKAVGELSPLRTAVWRDEQSLRGKSAPLWLTWKLVQ